jgi:hypothetical protein
MFLGTADRPDSLRRIAPGQPGDLCVLLLSAPAGEVLARLDSSLVAATVVAGELHRVVS